MATPASKPRPTLSRERILAEGMRLIEARGVDRLTMRALADAMHTAPMSLYRHVRNKDDLLMGIAGLALDRLEVELPQRGSWTHRAGAWMRAMRLQLSRHPAALPALMQHGQLAPAYLRALHTLIQILRAAGFEGRDAVRACREIAWVSLAFVSAELSSPGAATRPAAAPADSPYARIDELSEDARRELAPLLPHFLDHDADALFDDVVEHVLFGLDRRRAAHGGCAAEDAP